MQRLNIKLTGDEVKALYAVAEREHRELPQQAAWLIRQSLERLGLLQPTPTIPTKQESANVRQPA